MTYYIRLDDACEKRDIAKWNCMESLLDKHSIKPLVGIIPCCQDPMMAEYKKDPLFWQRVDAWKQKGWGIALHGFQHVCVTKEGGLNPVNKRSEFAGVPLEEQKIKIHEGVGIFRTHGIDPKVFFAPSHTFDLNTLRALKEESNIRIISDTIANKPYTRWGFTFIPQQSGHVRKLPFHTVTFCYHPNVMTKFDFEYLDLFIEKYRTKFGDFSDIFTETKRTLNLMDKFLHFLYFARRK